MLNFVNAAQEFEGTNTIYFRGTDPQTGTPVLLKQLRMQIEDEAKISLMMDEIETCKHLAHPGILRPLGIGSIEAEPVLILENVQGQVLQNVLKQSGKIALDLFLRLAIALAEVMAYLHEKNISPKNLRPDQLFVDLETASVALTGMSPMVEKDGIQLQEGAENSYVASYIAPEQTGRINRQPDQRTDLYSLGIIFYEMLSGSLPFENEDYLDIIHFHLAGNAKPLDLAVPGTPQVVADLVAKLLQKNPEDRYPSAEILKADLETCLQNLVWSEAGYQIKAFILNAKGAGAETELPQRVIGRDFELEVLRSAFLRTQESGIPQLVMVSGPSGVGKTTLVRKLEPYVQALGGAFLQGKYDQYAKNTPYSSFIHAFNALFREILVQDKEHVAAWKERFLLGLGSNASIIATILPMVEKIIGPQEGGEGLSFSEAENRLKLAVIRFLQTVGSRQHPLALFIDDLQWVDLSSLLLMESIMTELENVYIVMIGAYRSNEVDPAHPLRRLLDKLSSTGSKNRIDIELKPLSQLQVHDYIEEAFNLGHLGTDMLAKLCFEKSKGNPFYLQHFLHFLRDERMITYDAVHHWSIVPQRLLQESTETDLALLILHKLNKLPEQTLEVLKLAACVNNEFDGSILSRVMHRPQQLVEGSLSKALAEELLVRVSEGRYRFAHDRIQLAVLSLVDEKNKTVFHYQLGKLLLQESPVLEDSENLFEITEHLIQAEALIAQAGESHLMTLLYLQAGKRAKRFGAHEKALEYLSKGIDYLGINGWHDDYELALGLYTEGAEVAYICGQYEIMDKHGQSVIEHSRSILDQVRIYEIKVNYLCAQNRFAEAIDTTRQGLSLFGIHIPLNPTQFDIMSLYVKVRIALLGRKLEDLRALPEMTDQKQRAIMRILASPSTAAYTYNSAFMIMQILHVVKMSLKYGKAPLTPVAFTSYGHFIGAYLNQWEQGYEIAGLGLELLDTLRSKVYECQTKQIYETLIRHTREPLRNSLKGYPATHQMGMNNGDFMTSGHILMQHCAYSYLAGRPFSEILAEFRDYRADLLKTNNKTATAVTLMFLQSLTTMSQESPEPWSLAGDYFNEETELEYFRDIGDKSVLGCYHLLKMMNCFYFARVTEALTHLEALEKYLEGVTGTFAVPVYQFYGALIHLELLSTDPDKPNKKSIIKTVRKHIKALERVFKLAPENCENKICLLKAEVARLDGSQELALSYYDQSLEAAKQNGFLQDEALAAEFAARFLMGQGEESNAEKYKKRAIDCYERWGCSSKVRMLQKLWTQATEEVAATREYPAPKIPDLDIEAIMRASQAISEELVLSELLKKMIWIVLQNAGASRVLFIMEREGQLYIEVEGTADDRKVMVGGGTLLDQNPKAILKILNYVHNTGEGIIFRSRKEIDAFVGEGFKESKEKSLLCMPVESKRRFIGILYLENDLIDGAFKDKHMLILKVIASQLGISIENARLYQSIERVVEERTEQLIRKNLELEDSNLQLENAMRTKDEFLANMSHEMRTPLHGIIGLAGLIKNNELVLNKAEAVENIVYSAHSLLEIINEILDFSKLQANKVDLKVEDFLLNQLVKELLPAFQLRAEGKGLELTWEIRQERAGALRGDAIKIKQILTNLLGNAIKFTERGRIDLRLLVAESGEKLVNLEIEVRDTGIGIPKRDRESIFQEFVQVDSSAARKFGGTGLGLPITKKLITLLNGEISVESEQGVGSVFHCRIPLEFSGLDIFTATVANRANLKTARNALAPLTLLVAEDNPISSKYIRVLLEFIGCRVLLANDGLEVLDLLNSAEVDAILMDKNMPGLDGVETTKMIRRNEEQTGTHIPIIALTASAVQGEREKLLESGMDYYLSKPLDEQALVAILQSIKGEHPTGSHENSLASGLPPAFLPSSDGVIGHTGVFPEESAEGWIDKVTFLEEAELYGTEVMLEIITDFLTGAAETLGLIEEAIRTSDFVTAEKILHRLAGTVSVFQSPRLVDQLKGLERKAGEKEQDSLRAAFNGIKEGMSGLAQELSSIKEHLQQG